MTGISRKLPDTERARLKDILRKIVPEDAGVIIRTAAEGASEEELTRDVQRLQAQWEVIQEQGRPDQERARRCSTRSRTCELRVVRDVFNEDFTELVVSGDEAWETDPAVRRARRAGPAAAAAAVRPARPTLFHDLRIDEQLLKALDRKVWLPSGGSLVIDRTEAMTVIDVNTGKFVGQGGNLEQTVTRNNLEAAEEIVRQLRLRDIGGIIVIDFIDMVLESNRDLVLRRLTECLGRDRTKHQVAEVTSLGLVQMTRKRVGQGLLEAFSEPCPTCGGRGLIVHTEPVDDSRRRGGSAAPEAEAAPSGRGRRGRRGAAAEVVTIPPTPALLAGSAPSAPVDDAAAALAPAGAVEAAGAAEAPDAVEGGVPEVAGAGPAARCRRGGRCGPGPAHGGRARRGVRGPPARRRGAGRGAGRSSRRPMSRSWPPLAPALEPRPELPTGAGVDRRRRRSRPAATATGRHRGGDAGRRAARPARRSRCTRPTSGPACAPAGGLTRPPAGPYPVRWPARRWARPCVRRLGAAMPARPEEPSVRCTPSSRPAESSTRWRSVTSSRSRRSPASPGRASTLPALLLVDGEDVTTDVDRAGQGRGDRRGRRAHQGPEDPDPPLQEQDRLPPPAWVTASR